MMKLLLSCYQFECRLFQKVNQHFQNKYLNFFFSSITHLGGAIFTIAIVLFLLLSTTDATRMVAIASAVSLAVSHIPVQLLKKVFPRKRPYLTLEEALCPSNPLQDHSFPSGHTTAIFSVILPFVLFLPTLSLLLIPLGLCVGISRIYLGLHYPSDVFAGLLLGTFTGSVSYFFIFVQ